MKAIPSLTINNGVISLSGHQLLHLQSPATSEEAYRAIGTQYPKFFKMDALCKWAWIGAEALLKEETGMRYDGLDKRRIAVVLATSAGCIDTDRRYAATIKDIASPALFVYTLPNIMHGEICIRHGFGGEQLCLMQPEYDEEEISFWCDDLMQRGNTDACLAGWVDVREGLAELSFSWRLKSQKQELL